jgi:hypothetical protein
MLRVESDSFAPDERTQLEACIAAAEAEGGKGELVRRLAVFTFLGFFVLSPIALGLSWLLDWHTSVALLLVGPAIGAVTAWVTHRRFESRRVRWVLALETDLGGGEAEVLVAEPERAAVVRGDVDSPSGALFLEVSQGELLYLQGPVLEDAATSSPSSKITVRSGPRSRVVLGIDWGGESIRPIRSLESLAAWKKGYPRSDRAFLVAGTLEQIETLVRRPEFLQQLRASWD